MTHICRTCLFIITEDSNYVNLSDNTPASLEIRYKLSYGLPEMNVQLVSETLLCGSCLDIVDFIFKFKKQCLLIEQGIYRYIHNKGVDDVSENACSLSEVYSSGVIEPKVEQINGTDGNIETHSVSTDHIASSDEEEEEVVVTPQIENIFEAYREEVNVLNGDMHACSMCTFNTQNYLHLRKHMKIHGIKMQFECKFCKYQTFNKHNFVTHSRVHTGEKPFQCTICNSNFALKSTLIQHRNIHTKERVHTCTVCGFKTVHRRALGDHMMRHTGEKPYACDQCIFRTARKRYLRMHIDKRHNSNMKQDQVCIME